MHKDEFKGGKVLLQLSGKCERNKVDEGSRLAGPGEGVEKDEVRMETDQRREIMFGGDLALGLGG